MTTKEFRKEFSVGDQIHGYPIGYGGTITAIGRGRFLYVDTWGRERVASIEHRIGTWDWERGLGKKDD